MEGKVDPGILTKFIDEDVPFYFLNEKDEVLLEFSGRTFSFLKLNVYDNFKIETKHLRTIVFPILFEKNKGVTIKRQEIFNKNQTVDEKYFLSKISEFINFRILSGNVKKATLMEQGGIKLSVAIPDKEGNLNFFGNHVICCILSNCSIIFDLNDKSDKNIIIEKTEYFLTNEERSWLAKKFPRSVKTVRGYINENGEICYETVILEYDGNLRIRNNRQK
jgi:hypothetical protein